jgi:hypothetical protein
MSAIIQIDLIEAIVDGYHWTSKSKPLADMLNAMLDPLGPSGADPNPDETAAIEAAELIGAEVVKVEPVRLSRWTSTIERCINDRP